MFGWPILKSFGIDRGTVDRISVLVFLTCRTPIANHLQLVDGTHVSDAVFKVFRVMPVHLVMVVNCGLDLFEQRIVFVAAIRRVPQLADRAGEVLRLCPSIFRQVVDNCSPYQLRCQLPKEPSDPKFMCCVFGPVFHYAHTEVKHRSFHRR